MNALEVNQFTEAWQSLGSQIPRPRAILAISAHWWTRGTAVTAMTNPRTIYDFTGFPPELSAVQYNAPGSPELASRVAELLAPRTVDINEESWGLDHGTWSVLVHMYPDADIPVVQLSLDSSLTFDEHFEIGRQLAPLTQEGVLVVGSGNVVHNLSRINWQGGNTGFDWANRFDAYIADIMTTQPATVVDAPSHGDWPIAAPTPEHFLPLVYIAGIAHEQKQSVRVFNNERTLGSLSMTSYVTQVA